MSEAHQTYGTHRAQAFRRHRQWHRAPARVDQSLPTSDQRNRGRVMPRSRDRATLEAGLKLDVNSLLRRAFIKPGSYGQSGIRWTDRCYDEERAAGVISSDMTNPDDAWFRIQIGSLSQRIMLVARPRHFGGHQWYFRCPRTGRSASVLWMPPGAESFACRQRWGRQVAYQSQFLDAVGRAHLGKDRINRRLCSIGSLDPDEWDFPPKPRWMRWPTYRRAEANFDRYEETLDWGCLEVVAKILGKDWNG